MTTHLKPRSATVVIYQGDDLNTLSELKRAADLAERIATQVGESGTAREGDDVSAQAEKDAFDAFVDEAAERALSVELRSIGKVPFRDLLTAHPPRMVTEKVPATDDTPESTREVEHEDDAGYGVNTEAFSVALLTFVDPDDPENRTIFAPDFITPTALRKFIDREVSEGDFDTLWLAAYGLNRSPSRDPKAVRFSTTSQSTDETST